MATLSRPQLVLKSIQEDGQDLTHTTLQVIKTATMTYGTLLVADFTEAVAADVTTTYAVAYVIDDYRLLDEDVATGDVLTVRAVSKPEFLILRSSLLKLGSTALTEAQVTAYVAGSNVIDVQA